MSAIFITGAQKDVVATPSAVRLNSAALDSASMRPTTRGGDLFRVPVNLF